MAFILTHMFHTVIQFLYSEKDKRGRLMYLSGQNESGVNKNNESEKAFVKTK